MATTTTGTLPQSRFIAEVARLRSQGAPPSRSRVILRPSQGGGVKNASDTLRREFQKHERKWVAETMFHSSPVERYLHPSYARIIGLGQPVIPHILASLEKTPNDWFYALRAITGENPVPDSIAGDVVAMSGVWLDWGKARGLI